MRKPIHNPEKADFDIQVDNFVADGAMDEVRGVPLITVYKNTTKDYPGKWVARLFDIRPGEVIRTRCIMLADQVSELYKAKPNNMMVLAPQANDDPCILEVWV